MPRHFSKGTKKKGLPPGSLVYEGEAREGRPRITLIDYNESALTEKTVETVEECFPFRESPTVTWINIDGIHDVGIVEKIGEKFGIHPLVLEDIVTAGQRPKMEEFEDHLFVVARMLSFRDSSQEIISEQVSFIVGKGYVITLQERQGDVFDPIRERLRSGKGRIIKQGSDYLAYALIDVIIDNYFTILEKIGDRVETMDDDIVTDPEPDTLQEIQKIKHEMIFLRRSVWPMREVVNGMERIESPLIMKQTRPYLRDLYDHTIQVMDSIDSLRDIVSGLLDIYLSSVSNKMNEVMKVLTIIATIFIPITFIAGIYGMNFEFMPELKFKWAYPSIWGLIIVVSIIMLAYFRKKRWL